MPELYLYSLRGAAGISTARSHFSGVPSPDGRDKLVTPFVRHLPGLRFRLDQPSSRIFVPFGDALERRASMGFRYLLPARQGHQAPPLPVPETSARRDGRAGATDFSYSQIFRLLRCIAALAFICGYSDGSNLTYGFDFVSGTSAQCLGRFA